jgi:hypothetical protein
MDHEVLVPGEGISFGLEEAVTKDCTAFDLGQGIEERGHEVGVLCCKVHEAQKSGHCYACKCLVSLGGGGGSGVGRRG